MVSLRSSIFTTLEADLWVIDRTLRILFGEVGQVVKGIRQSITKRGH